ncbi:MAG TPA: NAD(P)-binding domain-containing protein [Fimbriimonas sp.]|nr:NAD(P)-binding domain-containing protein [Fimbriimonas sp.]
MVGKDQIDVAIVGAGPYGTSLALNLKAAGMSYRVFGKPMDTWINHMPPGMFLKSEGNASDIYDPTGYDLSKYCAERNIPWKAVTLPVPLQVFCDYGMNRYNTLGATADMRQVTSVAQDGSGFRLVLDDGSEVKAKRVVLAVGITHFAHIPEEFQAIKTPLIKHSSEHGDLNQYKGKEVAIVGGGSSATDLGLTLAEAGADVTVIARQEVKWTAKRSEKRKLWVRMRWPDSCMGPGIKARLFEKNPHRLRTVLNAETRYHYMRNFAGPAGAWQIREAFEKKVCEVEHTKVSKIQEVGGQLAIDLTSDDGQKKQLVVDQLFTATGYRANLGRLPFLDKTLLDKIEQFNNTPVLSTFFESSIPGLYFVGNASAVSFGPLMRFVCGTPYTSQRLTPHLKAAA